MLHELRGISVPGGSSIRLDLGSIIPRRGDLALDVVTARGRIGADVLDRVDRVGSSPLTQDWLPGQAEPAKSNLLMGLAGGSGRRSVVIANGGLDEVRAQVKIVSEDSVFSPKGLDEVRIPPQSVVRVTVSSVIAEAIKDGALGLEVTASEPVTATLRSQVGDDLSHAVSGVPITGAATAVLPGGVAKGPKATEVSVVLAGASRTGTVTVVSRDADGSELDRTTIDVTPGRGFTIPVPAEAVQVTVTPAKAAVTGAVLVSRQGGAAVLPLTVPVTSGLVPNVRPGLS